MMRIALGLARRGLGRTAPNPAVGAVIADERTGVVIARGWTQPGGRPHAETEAIGRAGDHARGATMYVTLEPCSHHGKTGPCADAVIAAGLARVVVAIPDPDPRVSGRGLERLRAAGITVERGLMAAEADLVTRGHIVRVCERRPFVQLKMAVGADGTVPAGTGRRPVWATGALARAHGHRLRAGADAIMIGRGTLLADDPELTCRLAGMADRSPIRVVLARDGLPAGAWKLVNGDGPPVLVVTAPAVAVRHEADRVRRLEAPVVGGRLWLPAVLEALVGEGVTRLLVEGGPALWGSFASAGLADEIVLYHARRSPLTPVTDVEAAAVVARLTFCTSLQPAFTLADRRPIGEDDVFIFRRS